MRTHVRDSNIRGCATTSGTPMRNLTRDTLERVRLKKWLAVAGLLAVIIGGLVSTGY